MSDFEPPRKKVKLNQHIKYQQAKKKYINTEYKTNEKNTSSSSAFILYKKFNINIITKESLLDISITNWMQLYKYFDDYYTLPDGMKRDLIHPIFDNNKNRFYKGMLLNSPASCKRTKISKCIVDYDVEMRKAPFSKLSRRIEMHDRLIEEIKKIPFCYIQVNCFCFCF